MSKIACVAIQYNKHDVCGTLSSNAAFQQWAYIHGHQADQIGFTGRGKALSQWIDPGDGLLFSHRSDTYYDVLNSYDAVYFSTGGSRPSSEKVEIMEFKYLRVPFMVGVHDENDWTAYEHGYQGMAHHRMFRGLVVNGLEAFDLIPIEPKIHYFPCTLPGYLLRESTKWEPQTSGLIYAGRVIAWRLLRILAKLTKDDEFLCQLQGHVEVRGVAPGQGGFNLDKELAGTDPRWTRVPGYYDFLNSSVVRAMYASRRFFWEVGSVDPGKSYYRRMNLVAVEAMTHGVIPIVAPAFAPEWTHEFAILFHNYRNLREATKDLTRATRDLTKKLQDVNDNYDHHRARMREIILNSHWSYEGVKNQFQKVLKRLLG